MLIHISGPPGVRSQNSLLPSIFAPVFPGFGAEQFLHLNIYGSPGPHVKGFYIVSILLSMTGERSGWELLHQLTHGIKTLR